jgi:general secretion pathway protein K
MVQSMRISYFDDLRAVPGYTPAVMEKLKDYVVVLPEVTPTINVNTASAELIAATVGTLSLPDAKALVATRARSGHFNDIKNGFETTARISLDATQEALLATTTDYFIVNGNVRLSHAALHMQTLIQRSRAAIGTPQATRLWWIRQR